MKQVILCGGCDKIIRRAGTFIAELTRPKTIQGITLPETEKVKIHLCRACASEAGYKVRE